MHVPFLATEAHLNQYGTPSEESAILATVLGSHRAISIFRGRHFGTPAQKLEVVYGESKLPAYVDGQWKILPTKMGNPLFGSSGFGNFWNNYTWTMGVYNKKLYVGTMDWSYLASDMLKSLVETRTKSPMVTKLTLPGQIAGADLYSFSSKQEPASPVSLDGIGNPTNYGIRTMLTDDALYLGTANPMNIHPKGGWELIKATTNK